MSNEWEIRAKKYDNIGWVSDVVQINNLINFCDLQSSDWVLDAGCGTGVLLPHLKKLVENVDAFDGSKDMLEKAKELKSDVYLHNIEESFQYHYYNKIISRMVFHHVNNLDTAFKNCYDALADNGWLILEEGVSPSDDEVVTKWSTEIRDLKEKRNHFTESNLIERFEKAGFKNITCQYTIKDNFSVNNWLKNSWKDEELYNIVLDKHLNAPQCVKDAYGMKIDDDGVNITIQTRVLFIKGQKL